MILDKKCFLIFGTFSNVWHFFTLLWRNGTRKLLRVKANSHTHTNSNPSTCDASDGFSGSGLSEGVSTDRQRTAQDLNLAANQGNIVAQVNYGFCLHQGERVSIDLKGAAHYFKLASDQGFANAQFNYGLCLQKSEGVRIDFKEEAHLFTLGADQGVALIEFDQN
jgi:TPR repeat protein